MAALLALAYLPFVQWLAPQVSAFIGALLALRFAALRWPALTPGRWLLLPLTLAAIVNVISAYASVSGQAGGSALLVSMLVLKLLEVRGKRDLRLLTVLFGFLLATQFLFDQSPQLVLYLLVLLVANLALMADLTARSEPRPLVGALRLAGRMLLLSLPLASALFLLFPRLDTPLWSLGGDDDVALTGLSDGLEPGSITELILSGEPAFRVWFEGPAPAQAQLYWRGLVLWRTDGRRWLATGEDRLDFEGRPAQPLTETDRLIAYRVTLEPTDQHWLLALDMPVAPPTQARLSADYQVRTKDKLTDLERYQMVSAVRWRTGELTPAMAAAGRQLPPNITPRMRALAAEWRRDANSDRQVIERGLAHIRRDAYYYTLSPPPLGGNPVDELLFETRRGFCEHYASAFAVMLRLAEIPTRVVLGYHGGELNPVGDYHIVRQSDAHAWIEAWLPGEGWQRFDPTAAIAEERIERGPLVEGLGASPPLRFATGELGQLMSFGHRLRLIADAFQTGWQNWILDFSTNEQLALLSLVGLGWLNHYGLALAMLLAAATVLGLTVLYLARGRQREPIDALFDRFAARLARIGLRRERREGPRDYGQRVIAQRPELRPVVEPFLSLYLRLRYGRADPAPGLPLLRRYLQRVRPRRGKRKPRRSGPIDKG